MFARTTGVWRLGLERVNEFLARIGDPHRAFPVFHVAGTNGKGSVVATLDTLLRNAGFKVGRYTSPHLVDFRERIVINGQPMPAEELVKWLDEKSGLVEELGATFFEVTTAMAFDWFRISGVDVAVIEVGLGGRLDATNVVDPVCAGITSIGIDHEEFLGSSLAEVALEKAGIFKAGRASVIGDLNPDVQKLLVDAAEDVGAQTPLVTGRDWHVGNVQVDGSGTRFSLSGLMGHDIQLKTSLTGSFQADNACVALAMLKAAGEPWSSVIETAPRVLPQIRLAGRFQRSGQWIFDVAHNPAGAATTVQTLRATQLERPLWALLTVLRDKDWRGIIDTLAPVVDGFVISNAPSAPASRRWDIREAAEAAQKTGKPVIVEENFAKAMQLATESGGTALATGSFHTVGDVMERLPVDPLAG